MSFFLSSYLSLVKLSKNGCPKWKDWGTRILWLNDDTTADGQIKSIKNTIFWCRLDARSGELPTMFVIFFSFVDSSSHPRAVIHATRLPLPQNTRYLKEETTIHPHLLIFLFIYLHFILFFYAISSSSPTRKITEKILKRIKHKNKYLLIGRGNYIYFYTVGSSRCQTRIWNLNFQGRPPTLEILGQHNILSIIWPCA